MYKTLFTLQSDPLYEHTREWRARVVNLIMDTVEPLRHRRSTRSCTAPDGKTTLPQVPNSLPRRTVKATIWSIVKDAFSLAVDMNCQRDVIYTDMPRPSTEYHFDYREHREVTQDWDIPGQRIADLCQLAEGLAAPAYFSLECKVEAIIVPRLVRRGIEVPLTRTDTEKVTTTVPETVTIINAEGVEERIETLVRKEVEKSVTVIIGHRHEFDKERTLAKALVYAHRTFPTSLQTYKATNTPLRSTERRRRHPGVGSQSRAHLSRSRAQPPRSPRPTRRRRRNPLRQAPIARRAGRGV